MATRMLQRRGTAAEWAAANPVLSAGEIGFETDTKLVKVGDGTTPWTSLSTPFVSKSGGDTIRSYSATVSPLTLSGAPGQLDDLLSLDVNGAAPVLRVDPTGEVHQGAKQLANRQDEKTRTDATYIAFATIDALGDLLVGTGPDAVGRLARGTTGQRLTVLASGALAWAANDADTLDGIDSTGFLRTTGKAADSDKLDGIDSTGFLLVGGKAADSNLLDGIDSTTFARRDQSVSFSGTVTGTTGVYDGSARVYSSNNPPPSGGGSVITQNIKGTVTLGGAGAGSATIPAVVIARTQVTNLGGVQGAPTSSPVTSRVELTSTTTIAVVAGGGGQTIGYEVVEWSA